jgi:hypothetical protein
MEHDWTMEIRLSCGLSYICIDLHVANEGRTNVIVQLFLLDQTHCEILT